MPYNVIMDLEGRSEIVFCESAREASFRLRLLASKGVCQVRAMSTEGIVVPLDRLERIARSESAESVEGKPGPGAKPSASAA
ncbi:hypothetical protein [Hansschlegelia beijingensis]|uniref:Uncharacterized protein n=1 Tax=Hansschlegelia beijingensis TaxID=1133344 RepID=A0A7W6GGC4_9HYPH|nr:hypothetical protein [Hansschlegelia beijingensis]MBB3973953.1 hypothetical protein [Hansschlegelia beijingensis]